MVANYYYAVKYSIQIIALHINVNNIIGFFLNFLIIFDAVKYYLRVLSDLNVLMYLSFDVERIGNFLLRRVQFLSLFTFMGDEKSVISIWQMF